MGCGCSGRGTCFHDYAAQEAHLRGQHPANSSSLGARLATFQPNTVVQEDQLSKATAPSTSL